MVDSLGSDRAAAIRSRRELLAWAADERLMVHAYHMPFPGLGTVSRHGDAYSWLPHASQPAIGRD